MYPDGPLCVPEVNPDAFDGYTKRNITANPNCSTAQMVVALKPLHDAAKIKRAVVSTYQSVSCAGTSGMDEHLNQPRQIFVSDEKDVQEFTKLGRAECRERGCSTCKHPVTANHYEKHN